MLAGRLLDVVEVDWMLLGHRVDVVWMLWTPQSSCVLSDLVIGADTSAFCETCCSVSTPTAARNCSRWNPVHFPAQQTMTKRSQKGFRLPTLACFEKRVVAMRRQRGLTDIGSHVNRIKSVVAFTLGLQKMCCAVSFSEPFPSFFQ